MKTSIMLRMWKRCAVPKPATDEVDDERPFGPASTRTSVGEMPGRLLTPLALAHGQAFGAGKLWRLLPFKRWPWARRKRWSRREPKTGRCSAAQLCKPAGARRRRGSGHRVTDGPADPAFIKRRRRRCSHPRRRQGPDGRRPRWWRASEFLGHEVLPRGTVDQHQPRALQPGVSSSSCLSRLASETSVRQTEPSNR